MLSVLATLTGLATSLGQGVKQVNAGLNFLFQVEISTTVQVILLAAITGVATLSVLSGLDGGVMLIPTLLSFVWMPVFGGAAIYLQSTGAADIATAVRADVSTAMFVMLEQFPLPTLLCFIAIVLVVVFFVTSSDSGSLLELDDSQLFEVFHRFFSTLHRLGTVPQAGQHATGDFPLMGFVVDDE